MQEAQQTLGGTSERVSVGDAGEALHRGIPRNDVEAGVGDNHRVVESLDQAMAENFHGSDEYNSYTAVHRSGIDIA